MWLISKMISMYGIYVFDKKTGLGERMARKILVNVNEVLPPELFKQVVK